MDDSSSCKGDDLWYPTRHDCECTKACKIDRYLGLKVVYAKKYLLSKLVIAYEDEILNKTETSQVKKKVTWEKNCCLIYTMSLIIKSLL